MIDVGRLEQVLRHSPVIILDVETSGLSWQRDHSIGYVVTWGPRPDETIYLPFRHTGGGNSWDPRPMFAKVLASRTDVRLVFHNAAFDLGFFHTDGINFNGDLEDTMIDAYLVDERQRSFSLDACCRFFGVQEKRGEPLYQHLADKFGGSPDRKQMANFHKLPGDDPIGFDYSVGDGSSTYQLWEALQTPLDEQKLRTVWAVECRVIRVLHRMVMRGIRIDEERLHQVRGLAQRQLDVARNRLPSSFNENAPSQLKKLFVDAGHIDWPTTEKGNPSFAEHWLLTNPVGRDVVAVRKLSHLENTFFRPMAERHLYKGRVHCTFNQTRGDNEYGTTTGRLSSSNPNVQQVSKRDPVLGSLFRSFFVPEEGHLWGSPDLNQCFVAGTKVTVPGGD